MEEIMEVVGMSDICETLKKHETTLHFLTLNLTFGVYGYQIGYYYLFVWTYSSFMRKSFMIWHQTGS